MKETVKYKVSVVTAVYNVLVIQCKEKIFDIGEKKNCQMIKHNMH